MPTELETTNETINGLLKHHSVRNHSNQPIDQEILDAVLTGALSAPTSSNMNSWSVIIIRNPDLKRALAASTLGNDFINQAPVLLVWLADLSRAHNICIEHDQEPEVLKYQEAILVGTVDCSLAAQNAVVAAESLGLGTCYVGGIRTNMGAVSELLELPDYCFPLFGMTLGWPSKHETASVRPRLPLSARVFDESYKMDQAGPGIAQLEQTNAEYGKQQGKPNLSWIKTVLERWGSVSSLKGRENNRRYIAKRGLTDL